MIQNKNILFIGYVWPEPRASAAGIRILQLINFFKELDGVITFASPAKKGSYLFDLNSVGVAQEEIELNNSSFDIFIKTLQPAIVVFDRYMMEEQFGWRVAMHCPSALRILDTEDLHFLRNVRYNRFKAKKRFEISDLLNNELSKREIASIYRCDLSLIISEAEMELLQSVFKVPQELLWYVPFLINLNITKTKADWLPFEVKKDFIFIGNFLHAPNWEAVQELKKNIWPQIREKLPAERLHIYGAYAREKVKNFHNEKEGFLVHGWTDSAAEVMKKAKVCLTPLYFGAGLKGKLIEAMIYGTPSVTTAIGAEGINGVLPWPGTIVKNNESFAQGAIDLYTVKEVWETAREKSIKILQTRFNKQIHTCYFKKKLVTLLEEIEIHRENNFTGSMLMQQTTQASKYMSKWIEVKNAKSN